MSYQFLAAVCRTTVLTMASLLLLALFLLFGSLWAMHTYLLASGQTTYEILKGKEWQTPLAEACACCLQMSHSTSLKSGIAGAGIAVPYLGTFYAMCVGTVLTKRRMTHLVLVQMHEPLLARMHPDPGSHTSRRYRGPHSRQVRYSSIWPELMRRWIVGNPPPAPFSERWNMLQPVARVKHLSPSINGRQSDHIFVCPQVRESRGMPRCSSSPKNHSTISTASSHCHASD